MNSAAKKYFYKGYECSATYDESKGYWFCVVENCNYPFAFESSREGTIEGNLAYEVQQYIECCEQKGIAPQKEKLTAVAQRDRANAFNQSAHRQLQKKKQRQRERMQRAFDRSPMAKLYAAYIVLLPFTLWYTIAKVGSSIPWSNFFPYRANIESIKKPYLSILVCVLCVIFFVLGELDDELKISMMFFPQQSDFWGMFTSSLAHADFEHILFNLIFFWAFSTTVERIIGSSHYLFLFLAACLVIGVGDEIKNFGNPDPWPALGLSGVCSTMLGALLVLMPKVTIRTHFWFLWVIRTFNVPLWFLGFWFISQDLSGLLFSDNRHIGYLAHVLGAFTGILYAGVYAWRFPAYKQYAAIITSEPGTAIDDSRSLKLEPQKDGL